MKRRLVTMLSALVLVISACGNVPEPSGLADAPDEPTSAAVDSGETDAEAPLVEQGFPDTCPATSETFNMMNEGSYQVFGQIDQYDQATGQAVSQHIFIGTAWAVGNHLLATNAHVTQAFLDSAAQGMQFSRAIAVQAGSGDVVRLLRALTHPDYNGDPLGSPDVGLFTTQEALPTVLPLAPDDSVVDLGGEFELVGFPGDVDDFITVTPGVTVPQATSLIGTVTARRSHDDTQQVTVDTLDVYQHQAPTTPGTSGSAIAHCGLVFAINNAGTIQLVVIPTETGEMGIDRTAAASNNFAVHVRYIHRMVELFQANALQGFELPVVATMQQQVPNGQPGGQPGEQPGGQPEGQPDGQPGGQPEGQPDGQPGGQPEGQPDGQQQGTVYQFEANVASPTPHMFQVMADITTGEIQGVSNRDGGQFGLTGSADVNSGEFMIWDNSPEIDPNLPQGMYVGIFYEDGTLEGLYSEDGGATTYQLQGAVVG